MENSNAIIMGLSEKCLLDPYGTEFEKPTWCYFLIKKTCILLYRQKKVIALFIIHRTFSRHELPLMEINNDNYVITRIRA